MDELVLKLHLEQGLREHAFYFQRGKSHYVDLADLELTMQIRLA